MFAEKKFTLVLFFLGLAFLFEAQRYGFGTLATPEPGLVPFMMGLGFLALEAVDLGFPLAKRRQMASQPTASESLPPVKEIFKYPRTHFVFLTASGFLLTYIVGLPATVGVYAAVSAWFLGLRSWWKNLVFGISLGLLIHYLFEVFLETELPSGWLWSLIWG